MSRLFQYRVLAKDIDEDLVDRWAYENLGWCWCAGDPICAHHVEPKVPKKIMQLARWAKGPQFLSNRTSPNLSSRYYYFYSKEDVLAFKLMWEN